MDDIVSDSVRYALHQRQTQREAELMHRVRKRRPQAFQRRYRELMTKRSEEILTDGEYQELLRLTDDAEQFDLQRQTDIDSVRQQLGLQRLLPDLQQPKIQ